MNETKQWCPAGSHAEHMSGKAVGGSSIFGGWDKARQMSSGAKGAEEVGGWMIII